MSPENVTSYKSAGHCLTMLKFGTVVH